jgi:hypothetical protein
LRNGYDATFWETRDTLVNGNSDGPFTAPFEEAILRNLLLLDRKLHELGTRNNSLFREGDYASGTVTYQTPTSDVKVSGFIIRSIMRERSTTVITRQQLCVGGVPVLSRAAQLPWRHSYSWSRDETKRQWNLGNRTRIVTINLLLVGCPMAIGRFHPLVNRILHFPKSLAFESGSRLTQTESVYLRPGHSQTVCRSSRCAFQRRWNLG